MVFGYDQETLLLVYHIIAWVMTIATAGGLWHLRGRFGLGYWVASFLAIALSQALRPWIAVTWSPQIALVSGHGGGLLSGAFLVMGVRAFLGLTPAWGVNLFCVVMGSAFSFVLIVCADGSTWYSLVASLLLGAVLRLWAFAHAWRAWRAQGGFPWLLANAFLLGSALAHVARALSVLEAVTLPRNEVQLTNGHWLLVFDMLLIVQGLAILLLISDAFQREIRQLADMDLLTGLLNRRGLQARLLALENASARTAKASLREVLLVDVDRFKSVNDSYGHDAGDAVLRQLAERLAPHARQTAAIARMGGEEFVLVGYSRPGGDIQALAHAIVQSVRAQPFKIASGDLPVTVSIGVTLSNAGESFEAQLRRADQALYQAKNSGRDRWVLA
jgi:diguanylate cyclase (GGDEF)-like protein